MKLSAREFTEIVKGAYSALEYACERSCGDAEKILYELMQRELEQEKGHRRMDGKPARFLYPIGIMAKYFVVHKTLAALPAPKSWAGYASYNTRTKLGQELKATLLTRSEDIAAEFSNDVNVVAFAKLDFDYAVDGVLPAFKED